ncbi:MAG: RusA family crossover junction endodeoxyribonuclease [Sphingomonadales bacterium]|nr:MAG: RusA family crossover junction endodeoxyribonuclease [Sphingomonadales bacterium]
MPESQNPQVVQFSVGGRAIPKGRARSSSKNGFVRHYTPKATSDYEAVIRAAALVAMNGQPRFEGPVSMSIVVRCKPPLRTSKPRLAAMLAGAVLPTVRPDLDNVQKGVADALNKVVFRDDADIVHSIGSKRYAAEAGIDVTVRSISHSKDAGGRD